jgi:hypothetical protein
MIITRESILSALVFVTLATAALPQSAETSLAYKPRGDRYEGLIEPRKSGNGIELISATVNYQEPGVIMPSTIAIRFYMKDPTKVFVTVRGVKAAEDYWMNEVHPQKQWEAGLDNVFRWSTSEVLQKLQALGSLNSVYELGVVVCLGTECDASDTLQESVAPAFLYYSGVPTLVDAYRFTFKPITHESLTFNLYSEVNGEIQITPIESQVYSDVEPGEPFNVELKAPNRDGWYQLKVNGIKRISKERVEKTIRFYHRKYSE